MEKNNRPLVSIVIPCYNHEKFVQDCIQSVIDQTYENIELIIIDDGSKDHSVERIQKMVLKCEERFKNFEFRYRSNRGLCATLNESLNFCSGEFFSVLASDDLIVKDKIERQVNFLQNNPRSGGVFGNVQLIKNNDSISTLAKKNSRFKKFNFDDVINHNFKLLAPTQLLRLELIHRVKGFNENVILEDWYMWLKITELGYSLDSLKDIFAFYRRHDGNMSGRFDIMHKGRLDIIFLFKSKYNIVEPLANIYLVTANDYLIYDKRKSFKYFILATKSYYKLFYKINFNLKLLKFLFKFMVS